MSRPHATPLLVSAVNGGGVFVLAEGRVRRWSRVDTTGITRLPGGGVLLARQAEGRAELRRLRDGVVHRITLVDRSLDLHDVRAEGDRLLVVATQINTVFEFDLEFRELRHWSMPGEEDSQHVNSACVLDGRVLASRFGAFAQHRGYKGRTAGAGAVFDVDSGEVLIAGLSQPHSLLPDGDGGLWLCDSESGEVRRYVGARCERTFRFDGYPRGLALDGRHLHVGLSRSRNVVPHDIEGACVVTVDLETGEEFARVALPVDEVYDIRVLDAAELDLLHEAAFADAIAEYDTLVGERNQAVADAIRAHEGDARAAELRDAHAHAERAATMLHHANLHNASLVEELGRIGAEATHSAATSRHQAALLEEQAAWLALLEQEIASLRRADASHREDVAALASALADARERNGQLADAVAGLAGDDALLRAAAAMQADAIAVQRQALDAQASHIAWMAATKSWRWTRPLRRDEPPVPPPPPAFPAPALPPPRTFDVPTPHRLPSAPLESAFPERPPVAAASRAQVAISGLAFEEQQAPEVSILVTAFGGFEMTRDCLESIRDAGAGATFEVVLVEDASGEAEMDRFATVAGLRYLRNASNLGFLRSVNAALPSLRGRYVHLLNNDTRVRPGWLDALLHTHALFPDCGVAGSRLVGGDGLLQEAGAVVWSDGDGWNVGRGSAADDPAHDGLREVDYVSGASVLLPADLFRAVGGFDERYAPAYYEDTDLSFRLRERGMKTYYQPRSVVVHAEGGSHGTDTGAGGKAWQRRNREVFRQRWTAELARAQCPRGTLPFLASRRAQLRRMVLVADRHAPHTDRDAGSRAIWQFMRELQECGFDVRFWSLLPERDARYRALLEMHGIEYLDASRCSGGFRGWMAEHGAYLDDLVLSRPEVAEALLPQARGVTAARIVYYGHDIHFLRLQGQHEAEGGGDAAAVARMRAREIAVWRQSDVVLYPSAAEVREATAVLEAEGETRIVEAMPLFGFPPRAAAAPVPGGRAGLLFVGGFAHAPNRDGIRWFVAEAWSRLRAAFPDLRLAVAGAGADGLFDGLDADGVEVLGAVGEAELADRYAQSRVAIAPLRFGAGVKGKVLEAMNAGLPCVTTAVGIQGIEGASGLEVADDAAAFAERVAALLTDDDRWRRAAERAMAWIDRHYSVEALRGVVASLFDATPYASVAARVAAVDARMAARAGRQPG